MSAEAMGWVFRESPYKGVLFAIHLAMADTVNDTYHNEFWASTNHLAAKARVSDRMVRRGLHRMVAEGYLIVISERPGETRRYRFVMSSNPGHHVTPDTTSPLTPVQETPDTMSPPPLTPRPDPLTPCQGTPDTMSPNPKITQEIPTGTQLIRASDADFDAFWAVYPAKKGKGAARTAWAKAVKHTDPAVIIEGARRYANDPDRDPEFTKYPQGWLSASRWEDEPVARSVIPKRMQGLARWLEVSDESA